MEANFDNNIPIYIQVLDYIKAYIISGQIKPGEKLPSVREFANMFKVNPNTMQKALMELEEIKLIYTERTNGKYVTTDEKIIEMLKEEYANSIAQDFLKNMKKIGINEKEALDYLQRKEER